jgi:sterol desaturase/sphingolipid hydroxylase (fatty acid hydroxylase superfamily)
LNIVLASAELHRWHHARDLGPSNSNFGNNLIVWDRLLGTYQAPSRAPAEQRLGLDDVSFPGSYWAHLASPFILDRFARSASADAAP